jgi:type I restriction enzyme M protein
LSVHPAKVSYMSQPKGFQDKVSLIWAIADILRGDFKPHEYGQTILPFVVLRRLECALEETKDRVISKAQSLEGKIQDPDAILNKESGHSFYNVSPLSLSKILQDPNNVATNLNSYIQAFSPSASEVIEKFGFTAKITKLDEKGLLYKIVGKFADLDLSVKSVPNGTMGYIYEELLRRFSEMSNETAGEHYTPREVIRLMVNLLFIEDKAALTGQKPIRSIYDPACGTGGMLSVAEEYLQKLNPNIAVNVFGQELNDETWAMARSDLMIKGQDPKRITYGNSLTEQDGHEGTLFDYCISNPPYGDDWKKYETSVRREHAEKGFNGRYGAGLPKVSDGSFLFVQHMISKMKPVRKSVDGSSVVEGGSRIAIILSGSPMFSGQAESGESEIRRWILENDWLEGIVAMPDQMFYNTEIGTFIWILSNHKDEASRGKIRLIDGRSMGTKMRRALGDKKKELNDSAIEEITRLYTDAKSNLSDSRVKIMNTEDFGFARITIEQPLRCVWKLKNEDLEKIDENLRGTLKSIIGKSFKTIDETTFVLSELGIKPKELKSILNLMTVVDQGAEPHTNSKGSLVADPNLRDFDNIPLPAGFMTMTEKEKAACLTRLSEEFLQHEIHKHYPDAWIDFTRTKIGYEIPFTRQFYTFVPPRPTAEVRAEIETLEENIRSLMGELA